MSDLWDLAHARHAVGVVRDGKVPIGYQGGNLRSVSVEEIEEAKALGRGYSGPVACAMVGVSYRQLDYWARTDLIKPSLHGANGSGSRRRYSEEDIRMLKIIKRMLDFGIQLQAVRQLVLDIGEEIPPAGSIMVFSADVDNHTRGGHAVINVSDVTVIPSDMPHMLYEKVCEAPCIVLVIE